MSTLPLFLTILRPCDRTRDPSTFNDKSLLYSMASITILTKLSLERSRIDADFNTFVCMRETETLPRKILKTRFLHRFYTRNLSITLKRSIYNKKREK